MGYANSIPYQQIVLSSTIEAQMAFSTVASSDTIGTIQIPNFTMPIAHAYLDLHCGVIENDHVNTNYFTSAGGFGVVTGVTYHESHAMVGGEGFSEHGIFQVGQYVIPGEIDIGAYLSPGTNQTVRFNIVTTAENSYILWSVFAVLRIYFGM